ncbi:hypothetical protein MLD38_005509 [Melastoma candidum]|uniref:Uncharacterized protein n=1 Tax=Melastoma candidum TaxID=119954 RepID=A0ACB9RJX2_9MYRT|nr:hypothetical protein MLD38_005509 [Melastoma candidum]
MRLPSHEAKQQGNQELLQLMLGNTDQRCSTIDNLLLERILVVFRVVRLLRVAVVVHEALVDLSSCDYKEGLGQHNCNYDNLQGFHACKVAQFSLDSLN